KILASIDGSPGSFAPLADLANVVANGHGLRNRAVEFTTSTARYLKVKPETGDGRFSISELAVYCRAPTPFPPTFRAVDDTAREAPPSSETPEGVVDDPTKSGQRWGWGSVLAVLILALVVGGYDLANKGRVEATAQREGAEPAPAAERAIRRSLDDRLRLIF